MMKNLRWFARPQIFLLLLACLIFLPRLGVRELWSPDEPRFALLSQEMLERGDYIVPHIHGEVYTQKPPLQQWLIVLFSVPLGQVTEASARLPSALAAIGSVILTWFLGRRFYGERGGWISAAVLLTSAYFFLKGRWCATDMLLSFFFLLAMVLGYLCANSKGWIKQLYGCGFFASCALATLTKGPVGLILPVGVVVLFLMIERRWKDLLYFPWIPGFATYFALAAPWYILFTKHSSLDQVGIVLVKENIKRYLQAWNNVRPFYYYLARFPLSFLPWSFFLPSIALALYRKRKEKALPPLRFVLIWFCVVFLFFSFSSGKRTVYLLPLFPAASLIVGWFFDRGIKLVGGIRSKWIMGTLLVLFIIASVFGMSLPAFLSDIPPNAQISVAVLWICLIAAFVWPMIAANRSNLRGTLHGLVFTVLVAGLLSIHWFAPMMSDYKNVRNMAAQIKDLVPSGAKFAVVEKKREAFLFYTGLRGEIINSKEELKQLMDLEEPVFCLLTEQEWDRYRFRSMSDSKVLLRAHVSEWTFVLVTNEVQNDEQ